MAKLKKETQRSQAQTEDFKVASDEKAPSFDKQGTYSEKSLHDFLARLRGDSTIKSERCNIDQKDIVRRVVEQIINDSKFLADRRRRRPQQFIRLLHGGPGTGKSHVIKTLKEKMFEAELGWTAGVDFQIGAFPAVNADNIDGDTLHHALGLQPFGARKKTGATSNNKKKIDASARVAQWKWLIIDEISMVSATSWQN